MVIIKLGYHQLAAHFTSPSISKPHVGPITALISDDKKDYPSEDLRQRISIKRERIRGNECDDKLIM
jgi:hypothetical protein